LAILRNQNEIIKEYHSSLLSTVYWSASALITVAVLLVGFGWWSNFRMHEKDRERLKQEILATVVELESKVDVKLSESRTDYLKSLDSRFESFWERISESQSSLKSDILENSNSIKETKSSLSDFVIKMDDAFKNSAKNLSFSESNLRMVEERVWEMRGIPENVIITQIQGIEAAIEAENFDRVGMILNRLKKTLKKLSEDGSSIGEYPAKEINSVIENAREHHPIDTAEVIGILNSLPIAESQP